MALSNCWSDVLRTYYLDGNLVLFVDLRTGGYADLSSYARTVTLTNAARPSYWKTRTDGKGLDFSGVTGTSSGYLSIATAAALDLRPSGTIAVFMRTEKGYGGSSRLAFKRNPGVSCAYDIYDAGAAYATTGRLTASDGATAHDLGSFSWPGARSLIVSFATGAVPWGYANGVRLTPPATLWASTADATSVVLPGATGSAVEGAVWWGWALFSTRLSGLEIAQLHSDFMTSAHVL
jgi:hypothetical protein